MTNNGNMEKSRSHGLIYLTFPILTLSQSLGENMSKYIMTYMYL